MYLWIYKAKFSNKKDNEELSSILSFYLCCLSYSSVFDTHWPDRQNVITKSLRFWCYVNRSYVKNNVGIEIANILTVF